MYTSGSSQPAGKPVWRGISNFSKSCVGRFAKFLREISLAGRKAESWCTFRRYRHVKIYFPFAYRTFQARSYKYRTRVLLNVLRIPLQFGMEVSAGAGGPIRREGSRADGPSRATVAYKGVHFGQRALAEASRRGLSVSGVMQTKEGAPGTRKKYTDARAVWKALLLVHDIAGSEWEQKTQQELLVVARAYVDNTVSRCAKGGLGPIQIVSSAVGRMHASVLSY